MYPPQHISCQDVHTNHMEERTRVVEVCNPSQVEYSSGHKKVPNSVRFNCCKRGKALPFFSHFIIVTVHKNGHAICYNGHYIV